MSDSDDARRQITKRILQSSKYRSLDPAFVDRTVAASASGRSPKAAEREARRRLHQAYGAFLSGRPTRAIEAACDAVEADPGRSPAAWREAMRAHRSTVEREPHVERFGELVASWCGRAHSVVDLAGGLGALTIPWLPIEPGGTYHAIDIDSALAAALAQLDRTMPVTVRTECLDLVGDPPHLTADVGLILKAGGDARRPTCGCRVRADQRPHLPAPDRQLRVSQPGWAPRVRDRPGRTRPRSRRRHRIRRRRRSAPR